MKRGIITLAVLSAWCAVGLNHASAQFGTLGQPPARTRPTVSPFINMGSTGAMGYYGLVKPQMDATHSIQQLQQNLSLINPDGSLKGQLDANQVNALGGLQTGHPATFFNYGHYYPLTPTGTSSANLGGSAGFGTGMGGYNTGLGTTGIGVGTIGNRTFFGANLNQGFRP